MIEKLIKLLKFKKVSYIFIFLIGVISSLSLPPYNYFYINFFTLGSLFFFLIKNNELSKKDYFLYGWLFGFGYFLSSLYWISISLTFDSDFKFLIPISIILIPSFLALFISIPVFLLSFFLKLSHLCLVLIFSILLASFEFIRGFILTGFPWNLFVYSFSDNLPFIQMLSVFGTYGLNLICISFFLIPSIFLLNKNRFELIISSILLVFFLSLFLIGNIRLKEENIVNRLNEIPLIKIISSKVEINRFYEPGNEENIINQLVSLSNPEKDIPTLFIWPEGVITSTHLKDILRYRDLFKKFSDNHLILFGINDIVLEDESKIYNSLAIVDNQLNLKSLYYKNNLVPFGEFLPLENILSKFGFKNITNKYQSFSDGKKRDIIYTKLNNFNLSILPLICYEIIYSGELSDKNNFDLIVNISEDGWFGKSIGPHQHFAHSVFRAIEEGKTILRSSNNGISAMISPKGKTLKIHKSTYSGVLKIDYFEKLREMTVFSSYGRNNIFFYLVAIYIILIFFLKRIGR